MSPPNLQLRIAERGAGERCTEVLDALPDWFGMPEANVDYADMADRNPTLIATIDGRTTGILTLVRHSDEAAEIHVMAVRPECHRQGVGVAMLTEAERVLRDQGVEYLQVKTLAETHPDTGYVKTRAFYRAQGFVPLEVFPTLWGAANPALQMIKRLDTGAGTTTGR